MVRPRVQIVVRIGGNIFLLPSGIRFAWLEKLPLSSRIFPEKKHVHLYRMVPPSDVCWFINPINYSYKYHKP